MVKFIVLITSLWLSSTQASVWDFANSNIDQEFCDDITHNLKEAGVSATHKSMIQCPFQVLGCASATFDRSYGGSVNARVKRDPYRMFVIRSENDNGTRFVLHSGKVARKVKDRDC